MNWFDYDNDYIYKISENTTNNLKKFTVKNNPGKTECSICLSEYDIGNKIFILKCNHHYCVTCLDAIVAESNKRNGNYYDRTPSNCPYCRGPLESANDERYKLPIHISRILLDDNKFRDLIQTNINLKKKLGISHLAESNKNLRSLDENDLELLLGKKEPKKQRNKKLKYVH
jgi:hypothetical protein